MPNYAHVNPLKNAANDAHDVADALTRLGFAVDFETDLTYEGMRRVLIGFAGRAAGADMAFVYYAGHGMEVDHRNFLVPVDATLATDRSLALEAVPADLVTDAVSGARRLRVVLLDACRNNPFAAQIKLTNATRSIGRGLSRVEPSAGTLVGYSARAGTTAEDGDGRNSPYATALLDNIETPGLEINLLFRKVRDEVLAATDRRQEPFTYGSLPGESIYLVDPPGGGATADSAKTGNPTPATPAVQEDRAAWETIKDTSSIAVLEAFVTRFPDSLYAEFARARVAEMRAQAARETVEPQQPATSAAPVAPVLPAGNGGDWFVIMGSFPHAARADAESRVAWLASLGIGAAIIDTDDYANLTDGYFSVVLGPYDKGSATNALAGIQGEVGDAYIKAAR